MWCLPGNIDYYPYRLYQYWSDIALYATGICQPRPRYFCIYPPSFLYSIIATRTLLIIVNFQNHRLACEFMYMNFLNLIICNKSFLPNLGLNSNNVSLRSQPLYCLHSFVWRSQATNVYHFYLDLSTKVLSVLI